MAKSKLRIKIANYYYFLSRKIFNLLWAFKFYFYNGFLRNVPIYSFRTLYLKSILKIKVGKNTSIHMGCYFAGQNIVIGSNTVIGRNCYLDGRLGLIEIMNNVSVAPDTCIISLTHDLNCPKFEVIAKSVKIEDYCWIGMRAMILPGVVLEEGVVVGAGSIVTKRVAKFTIVAGSPAKVIGNRNSDLKYNLSYFPLFNTDIII